jgi:hypothetical protein
MTVQWGRLRTSLLSSIFRRQVFCDYWSALLLKPMLVSRSFMGWTTSTSASLPMGAALTIIAAALTLTRKRRGSQRQCKTQTWMTRVGYFVLTDIVNRATYRCLSLIPMQSTWAWAPVCFGTASPLPRASPR